ncbi:hypothetical protein J6O48_13390, partial [bacterium]|nr:hypothetical protein [bacterium]
MKSRFLLALAIILLGIPSFGYSVIQNPNEEIYTYSSVFEEVLQKTGNYSWTVKESQILENWVEDLNIQIPSKLVITGKPKYSYSPIYFKPKQDLVMVLVNFENNEYKDNFQMQGIVVGINEVNNKPKYLSTKNVNFANFLTAITNNGGNVTLSNTGFIKNKSYINDGGAIYNKSGKLTLDKGTSFIYNLATDKGGAIFNGKEGKLVVKNSTIGGQHNEYIYHIMNASNLDSASSDDSFSSIKTESEVTYIKDRYLGDDNWITDYYLIPEWRDMLHYDSEWVNIYPLGNKAEYGGGIYSEGNASITGTTFKYNIAKKDGGGLYSSGKLTLKSSNLYSNKADRGGAVYIKENSVLNNILIQKNTFRANVAEGENGQGGAVFIESGNVNLKNNDFGLYGSDYSNSAVQGGAVFNSGNNTSIISSKFLNNYAEKGGDVYNKGTLTIKKSDFGYIPKTTYILFRPIYKYKNPGEITIDSETCVYKPIVVRPVRWEPIKVNYASSALKGGAIYNEGTISEITSSNFNFLSALEGGAIYNDSNATISLIKSSKFNSISAKNSDKESDSESLGGVIYNKGEINVIKSTFSNNSSGDKGGVIYNSDGKIDVQSSAFNGNYSAKGGVIYAIGGKVVDKKSNFKENYSQAGGAVFVKSGGDVELNSSTFISNKAYENVTKDGVTSQEYTSGGAIYVDEGKLTLNSVTFGNKKKKDKYSNLAKMGSAIFNAGNTKITKSNIFYHNSVYGAIYNTKNLDIQRSIFTNNNALAGGVLYNKPDSSSSVNILGSTFTSNKATLGGAIYSDGYLYIDKKEYKYIQRKKEKTGVEYPKFVSNRALSAGGAIYFSTNSVGNISNASFKSNSAYNENVKTSEKDGKTTQVIDYIGTGGAVYVGTDINDESENPKASDNHKITIKDTIFTSNMAGTSGGAVAVGANGKLEVSKSSFEKNKVSGIRVTKVITKQGRKITTQTNSEYLGTGGGAISNYGELNISQTSFTANSAPFGGAIYSTGSTNIEKSNFYSNTGYQGGAIYFTEAKTDSKLLNVTEGKFKNNFAYYGGGVYAQIGVDRNKEIKAVNIDGTYFESNIGYYGGGALFLENIDTVIKNADFIENVSYTSHMSINKEPLTGGGAILTNGVFNGEKLYFYKNKAFAGGAIYVSGTFNGDKLRFENNSAGGGGAVFVNKNTSFVLGEKETEQVTDDDGKEVTNLKFVPYDYEKQVNKFVSNSATQHGGAIYNTGYVYLNGVVFENNSARGDGGAIDSESASTNIVNATFKNNSATNGGAIFHVSNKYNLFVSGTRFNNNSAENGGALYLGQNSKATIVDTNFINNKASILGGAVFADENSNLTIVSQNSEVLFQGNTAKGKSSSIYLNNAELNLIGNNKITINDDIGGSGTISISGNVYIANKTQLENDSKIVFKLENGNLSVENENSLNSANIVSMGAGMDVANNKLGKVSLKSLVLPNNTVSNIAIDADLKSGASDKITAENVEGTGTLNVSSVNLTSNSKDAVTINLGEDSLVSSMSATTAETAEATYKLKSSIDNNGLLRAVAYAQKAKPCTLAAP